MHFSTCEFGIHGNKQTHIVILHCVTWIKTSLSNRHELFYPSYLDSFTKKEVSIFEYQLQMLSF